MAMPGEDAAGPAGWQAFLSQPAAYINKHQLFAMFGGAVGTRLCERLIGEPRLQPRLSALIADHFHLRALADEDALTPEDRTIALLPAEAFAPLARSAGAIYWSASIATLVLARDIVALYGVLGEGLCVDAVRHRDLSGPVQALQPFDTLMERIEGDGRLCLAGWCAAQVPGIGARVRIKLPDALSADDAIPPTFRDLGPAIMRRALATGSHAE